eukprot:scaffold101295_cov28-Prasinocladus_malaysianus.AAC.1
MHDRKAKWYCIIPTLLDSSDWRGQSTGGWTSGLSHVPAQAAATTLTKLSERSARFLPAITAPTTLNGKLSLVSTSR